MDLAVTVHPSAMMRKSHRGGAQKLRCRAGVAAIHDFVSVDSDCRNVELLYWHSDCRWLTDPLSMRYRRVEVFE